MLLPKHCVFLHLEFRMMDKVQKPSNSYSECGLLDHDAKISSIVGADQIFGEK
jgi:hypothetical protein